ncbi:MAG TPA: molybdenum cofactor guanylyltransferase [Chthoniobacterales bacterium]|nr:molybdenum cofactor guanylyltransferase [Chthoniobacterales bacterium]
MTFSALLLAGGESRRMGRDKATMEFEGRPFWERQTQLLRALGPEKIMVSARTAPSWLPHDVELLLDDPPSRGPLSGLAKALATIETTHLVVLAVDMPFMTPGELGGLLELATEGRGVVPAIGDRAEPLAAVYPAEAAEDLQAALAGSDFSLQLTVRTLVETGKVRLCRLPDGRTDLYRSVNEPGDFKEGRFETAP